MTLTANAPSYEEDSVAWLEDQAQRARRGQAGELNLETGLPLRDLPERCPFEVDEVLDPRWLPRRSGEASR